MCLYAVQYPNSKYLDSLENNLKGSDYNRYTVYLCFFINYYDSVLYFC